MTTHKLFARLLLAFSLLLGGRAAQATLTVSPQSVRVTSADGATVALVDAKGLQVQNPTAANFLVTATASGNFNNASVSATGAAVPASATYIGVNVAGNIVGAVGDASNNLKVVLFSGATALVGTAGTPSAAVLSIQGVASGTVIPVSQGAPSGMTTFRQGTAITATSTIVCSGSATVSQPTEMYQVAIHSSDYWRCSLQYNNNTALTVFGSCVTTPSAPTCVRTLPKSGWRPTAGAAGAQQWEAACTLFGGSTTPDLVCDTVYCTGSSC